MEKTSSKGMSKLLVTRIITRNVIKYFTSSTANENCGGTKKKSNNKTASADEITA
jgi:hypothetical protein